MANTTVSIRERVKITDGRWCWSAKIPIPKGKLSPAEAARTGAFYVRWTENGDLCYRALYEPAFRKEELMYLEKEDVLVDRQMLRVQSKTRYDEEGNVLYEYKAKANSEREVPISKELMQRIVTHMNDPARPESRLVFCTSTGRPDTHFWDKLQTIAKRAEMGGFDLKTFRATRATDWLRPKWLGGFGYDIQTVRDLLGHDEDSESIWSYLRAVKKEELVAEMNKEKEKAEDRCGCLCHTAPCQH